MTDLYFFKTSDRQTAEAQILKARAGENCKIAHLNSGKPYIESSPLNISISHSGDLCVIALSSAPVGVDTELLRGRERAHILKSFTAREQSEILNQEHFLKHWTVREAYAKLSGKGIWHMLGELEFYGGTLYHCSKRVAEEIQFFCSFGAVTAVCGTLGEIHLHDLIRRD